jgi:hypothetical protein
MFTVSTWLWQTHGCAVNAECDRRLQLRYIQKRARSISRLVDAFVCPCFDLLNKILPKHAVALIVSIRQGG